MSLDPATVRRIAKLARIRVDEGQVEALRTDLNSILGWIEQLNEVDVAGVEPLTGGTRMALRLRADVVDDGGRAEAVLGDGGPRATVTVCRTEPVLAGEVRYAVRVEGARTLQDVARRTNLAHGPCGGVECALAAAVIAGECLGWSPAEVRAQAAELLRARRKSRLPAIGAAQARLEGTVDAALRALGRAS